MAALWRRVWAEVVMWRAQVCPSNTMSWQSVTVPASQSADARHIATRRGTPYQDSAGYASIPFTWRQAPVLDLGSRRANRRLVFDCFA